ncbi:NAD(P)/FAD-dependent oxidoreductase [Aspergillus lucknowensis]|uniref:FAD/NAD(P)-binding domain-containing protein n=1 Tax=Aspergillus lucknowensis TaxID=176173 RepID=A0ABR4LIX0_9EURO
MAILSKLLAFTLALTGALSVSAASLPQTDYEVIVVGGGPAGLSVLSGLSRVRRKTALFDSHQYRNDPTREMHDVIGNDGTPPAEFRAAAREQISNYKTATFIDNAITSITPVNNNNFTTFFRATDATGAEYTARKVVLATGIVDVLPSTPGLAEGFGKGIFWCPWCDGYEHRDQPFGILGTLPHIVSSLLEITTLNTDIIAFVNGSYTDDQVAVLESDYPDWRAQIAAYNVRIDNRTIASIERLQDGGEVQNEAGDQQFDIFQINFTEGAPVIRNAFITNFETAQRSSIPYDLGLAMKDGKIDTSINPGMRTSLAGVFAVGDCNSDGSTNVPHAMFSGKRAAVYGHVELAREEMAAAIAKRSLSTRALQKEAERMMGDEMEMIWERVKA